MGYTAPVKDVLLAMCSMANAMSLTGAVYLMYVSEKSIFRQKKVIASDAFVRSWRS